MTLRALLARLWRLLRPSQPKPRAAAQRRPCAHCGRVVAHTLAGAAYVHRCRVDLVRDLAACADTEA